MATNATSKIDAAAEKAYAEAAAKEASAKEGASKEVEAKAAPAAQETKPAPVAPEAKAVPAVEEAKAAPKKAAPRKVAATKVAASKAPTKKVATKKVATKKVAVKKTAASKPAPKVATPVTNTNPIIKLKDTIMANAKTTEFAKTAKEMAAEVQARVKTAYAKTGEIASEVTEFNKGNVEALVESGKIFFAGVQELGREDVESGKSAIEAVTADVKKLASVQSPTEFMQLQGELARRNFDAAVSFGSKRTEALVKLYNDAFAPISNRVSLAAEKIKQAA